MAQNEAKITLTANDQTRAAIESAKRNLGSLQEIAASMPAKFGGIGVAIATAFQAASLKGVVDTMDKMDDLAEKTGIASSQLSVMRYAAEVAGTPLESLATGIRKLSINMVAAAAGGKDQAAVFDAMGISVKDAAGKIKGSDQIIGELANQFASFEDGPEKAALAVELFGKSGADMIPYLNKGAMGLAELTDEARKFGLIASDQANKEAGDFNDNLKKIELSSEAAKIAIASTLLPTLNNLAKEFLATKDGSNSLASTLGTGIAESLKAVVVFGREVAFVLGGVGREIGGIAAQFAALARGDFTGFSEIGRAIVEDAKRARLDVDRANAQTLYDFKDTAGAGRGISQLLGDWGKAEKKKRAPILSKTGDTKEPDKTALNFIAALEKQYRSATGAVSSYSDAQEYLAINSAKFTEEQKNRVNTIAQEIDAYRRREVMVRESVAGLQAQSDATEAARRSAESGIDSMRQAVQQQQFENSLLNQNVIVQERLRFERQQNTKLIEVESAISEAQTAGLLSEYEATKLLTEARRLAARSLDELTLAQRDALDKTYNPSRGVVEAVKDYNESIKKAGESAKAAAGSVLGSIEDGLVSLVTTGKFNARALVDTIIAEFTRLRVVRPLMGEIFGNGSAGAGILGQLFGSTSRSGFSPDAGLVANSSDFARQIGLPSFAVGTDFVPRDMIAQIHKGERIVPAAQNTGAGQGVVVNIVESPGGGGQVTQRQDGGQTIIDVVVSQVRAAIAGDISRGSGEVPAALAGTYGLNRVAGAY